MGLPMGAEKASGTASAGFLGISYGFVGFRCKDLEFREICQVGMRLRFSAHGGPCTTVKLAHKAQEIWSSLISLGLAA